MDIYMLIPCRMREACRTRKKREDLFVCRWLQSDVREEQAFELGVQDRNEKAQTWEVVRSGLKFTISLFGHVLTLWASVFSCVKWG